MGSFSLKHLLGAIHSCFTETNGHGDEGTGYTLFETAKLCHISGGDMVSITINNRTIGTTWDEVLSIYDTGRIYVSGIEKANGHWEFTVQELLPKVGPMINPDASYRRIRKERLWMHGVPDGVGIEQVFTELGYVPGVVYAAGDFYIQKGPDFRQFTEALWNCDPDILDTNEVSGETLRAMTVFTPRIDGVSTPKGRLQAMLSPDFNYPGIDIRLEKDGDSDFLARVEYDSSDGEIRSHIYGDSAVDYPTVSVSHKFQTEG